MPSAKRFSIVLVTVPDMKTARALARAALQAHLVACANLVPRIESHYWWHGKIEKGSEILVVFKTTSQCLTRLEKLVLEKHPYDTPEFLTLPVTSGTSRYLSWLAECVRPGA
jgi:periplasmic divalent cation tolerance protein